jgi:hypothetical protein
MPRAKPSDDAKRYVTAMYGPVSARHAAAIGRVAVEWARVEDHLGHLIGSPLLGLGDCPAGMAVTAEMNSLQRAVMVSTLLDCAAVEEWADRWRDIYREFERLRIRRNGVIHAAWTRGAKRGTHESGRVKAKGSLVVEIAPVSVEEMARLAAEIAALLERIVALDLLLTDGDAAGRIREGPAPLSEDRARTRAPSAAAQTQDQARARKRARKEADRAASRAARGGPGAS